MSGEEYPPILEQVEPAWVRCLSDKDRVTYEENRMEYIQNTSEIFTDIARAFEEMNGVSDEFICYLGLRVATAMRNEWEDGIQVGSDYTRENYQREISRLHSVEINRLGGWG